MSLLFDSTLQMIQGGLNARMERQATISSNIANADTPGYKARELTFEASLEKATSSAALRRTNASHMDANGNSSPVTTETRVSEVEGRTDGNNVDLE